MLSDKLRGHLDELQFGPDTKAILIDQVPVGYGGQLSRRLLGLKLALALDRKCLFALDADPPYVQSIYRPFTSDLVVSALTSAPEVDLFHPDQRPIVQFTFSKAQRVLENQHTTVDEWLNWRLRQHHNLSDRELKELDGWLFSWLNFLPEFEDSVRADLIRLAVSADCLGVHLRRGDKKVETPYVPPSKINEAIQEQYSKWKFRRIFLASDDDNAPSLLSSPAGVELIFDRSENRYNNANHKMLLAHPEIASQETYVAFKNLRLLSECGGIVGQDNAHLACIAASSMLNRGTPLERITLLDGSLAKLQSPFLHARYEVNARLRRTAKAILPNNILRTIGKLTNRIR